MLIPLLLNNFLGAFAAISGTAVSGLNETHIVAGGRTIIITLTGDTWVAAGAAFDAIRQDIIDGLDSAQSEVTGWNAEVRDKEVVTAVVRTSDTVVTITLSAAPDYAVTAHETITVTVPASAINGTSDLVGAPTFRAEAISKGVGAGKGRKKRRYLVEIDNQSFVVDNVAQARELMEMALMVAERDAEKIMAAPQARALQKFTIGQRKIPRPKISTKAPVLRRVVEKAIRDIDKMYERIESDPLFIESLERRLRNERDEEDAIILLM